MNVVIIGTGNVATILGKRIKQAGHTVLQVYGRTELSARRLAAALSCPWCSSLEALDREGGLYLVAVSDTALTTLPGQLKLHPRLVVHTAGSVSREVLKGCSANYGVLYPLQSLRRELDPLTEIPLLTDAGNEESRQILRDFARSLSDNIGEADDEKRMKLHLAAVISSNFVNHLYALAENYCRKEELDFSLLYPLIRETAVRLSTYSPAGLQTGPAVREDEPTISRHLTLLKAHPGLQALYRLLTASIQENKIIRENG